MGNFLQKGVTYSDGMQVNAANLNSLVDDAILKSTAISALTLKDPMALGDELIINDSGVLKKATGQQIYNLVIQPGTVIQRIESNITTAGSTTSIIPIDTTKPQISEGALYSGPYNITPRFSTSKIAVLFYGVVSSSVGNNIVVALFRDSVADTVCSTIQQVTSADNMFHVILGCIDSPATTSQVGYTIRFGASTAGTSYINRNSGGPYMGGSQFSTIVLQEIKQ